ncbi:hypothetical protein P7F88_11410 [Vibrio hannami]|uniref:COG3650 family protein n=1 Tax=Vibrio hannami TaxID=2717094 RepID=UPI00240F22FF|nr:hypothetical protein [Vibrio hannami]MDG3086679.1 hypothetical protein [Vibrio hannami]
MKASNALIPLSTLLFLQACSSPGTDNQLPGKQEVTLVSTETAVPQTFITRGSLVIGPDSRTFTPCGSSQQYWIQARPELLQAMDKVSPDNYQPLYAELIGHLVPTIQNTPSHDLEAQFIVSNINIVTAENPNRCYTKPVNTRAFGNEPFWALTIEKQHMLYQTPESDSTFNLTNKKLTSDKREYSSDKGELQLTKTLCADTMSDTLYGWKATNKLTNRKLDGCASLSNMDTTLNWSGNYSATSTKNGGFSISLTMKEDHSATITYSSEGTVGSTIERGFWQQVNPKQVQVIMTRYQGQRLISERLFTLSDGKLEAKEEIINGNKYPIADGGLVLYSEGSSN